MTPALKDKRVEFVINSSLLDEIRAAAEKDQEALSVWIRRALQERLEREARKT